MIEEAEEIITKLEDSEYLIWQRQENEVKWIEPHRPVAHHQVYQNMYNWNSRWRIVKKLEYLKK